MKLIIITTPHFWEGEAEAVEMLFHEGLESLHLRKPQASEEEMRCFLCSIPLEYHARIVTHEHFNLLNDFKLKGVHLNGRQPQIPAGWKGHVSRSCHSLEEVAIHKSCCQYVFLSPIYDSISKTGYRAAFQPDTLKEAARCVIIDTQVIALGGISAARLPEVKAMGFGGAALLGDVWQHTGQELAEYFNFLEQQAL